jgi:heme-degrading monooxygenase HmoA
MISRHWKGIVKPGKEEEYLRYFRNVTFPKVAKIEGFIRASILKRDVERGTEYLVVTVWESLDAIRRFAGETADQAVIPPEVDAVMLEYETVVHHYEVTDEYAP